MTRLRGMWFATALVTAVLTGGAAFGQTPPPASTPAAPPARGQRPAAGRAGRAGLPPAGVNISQQQLQDYLDTYALVQAKRVLMLSEEQAPTFNARLQRIQTIRRRNMGERRRIMGELVGLLNANPAARNEDIEARVKALDDASDALAVDLKKAYLDLDAVLTPWQRGKFRQFEEQIERQKIDLLTRIGGGAGGGSSAPEPTATPTPPGRGRGGL